MLVTNSSVLIHLTRLSKIRFLREHAGNVLMPEAVHAEVVQGGIAQGYGDAGAIENFEREGWIGVKPLRSRYRRFAKLLTSSLGEGEAQAIALAKQTQARLLIDDDHGRRIASYYDVDTLTTLGVILEIYLAHRITKQEYLSNVRRFSSQAWIGNDVIEEFVRRADKFA
jgi:predicted nucleic acid-binding protein